MDWLVLIRGEGSVVRLRTESGARTMLSPMALAFRVTSGQTLRRRYCVLAMSTVRQGAAYLFPVVEP